MFISGLNWTVGRFETGTMPNLAQATPEAHLLPKYVAPRAARGEESTRDRKEVAGRDERQRSQ